MVVNSSRTIEHWNSRIYRVSGQSCPVFGRKFDPKGGVKSKIRDQFFSIAIVDLDFRLLFNRGCLLKNFCNFDFKKIGQIQFCPLKFPWITVILVLWITVPSTYLGSQGIFCWSWGFPLVLANIRVGTVMRFDDFLFGDKDFMENCSFA